MSDGKVVFEIQGDPKGINTTLKDVTANIEKESKKWDDAAEQSTGKIEGFFSGMLKGIAGAITAAGITKLILDFGKASIEAASDLAEVQNVVDVTFGESAREIDAWAKQAGKSYGLTETAAKRYSSTIGAMLKSQGMNENEIVGMSEDLAGLAADMASFYNLDFDTAFDKIRSGITGQTEPLKQLGINMSVANLEAFALEQGITKSYTAMSQGEQTLLRYQYLMKATADAQGDFARTADGYANATRRVQASWETIKTKAGGLLMYAIEPLTSGLADMLDKLTEEPERTVLDDFADIDKDFTSRMAHLNETYNQAEAIIGVMNEIKAMTATVNGQTISFEQLFGDISAVEKSGGNIREYLSGLGLDADYIIQKYQIWNESTKQLTSTIPALSSVIDAETGAIDGSTEAIQSNLDAWKDAEEQKLEWTAYYARARALEEKKAEMYSYQYEADVAAELVKIQEQHIKELAEKLGRPMNPDGSYSYIVHGNMTARYSEEEKEFNAALDELARLQGKQKDAQAEAVNQADAFAEAERELAAGKQFLIDKYGEEADAAEYTAGAVTDYGDKSAEAWETSTSGAKDAIKALADYVETVHDATAKTVDGIVKGFETLERPTTELEKKRDKLIEQQNELNRSTKEGEKRYQELQTQIDDLNKSMSEYTPKGMQDALKSQLAFMDEYIANLDKAREMGLSDELLASLSDGSVQSAEYLSALVSNPEQAKEVDALFQQVQAKKGEFTDALTEQKLTVDETYNAMVEKAKTAIGELNLGGEAQEAMGETVAGLAQGISDHVPDVKEAVDALLYELNRLNSYGINISVGSFGDLFTDGSNLIDGEHATGLDYVPFDGYIAGLHEGEGILTAEENRVWQRFKNGAMPQTMDYDALGATMRENVHAGGNVYLDGRTVGQVISQQQGNSYRSLQRSGFQA